MKRIQESLDSIINDLQHDELSIVEIANKYDVSRNTITNINNGTSYYNKDLTYPIRKVKKKKGYNYYYKAFVQHYYKQYGLKRLHIILSQFNYNTLNNWLKEEIVPYSYNKELEERKFVFDCITKPRKEFITSQNSITLRDAVYIKFLARFGVSLADVIYTFIDVINYEGGYYKLKPLKTKEDVEKYLDWGGTESRIIWYIKNVWYQKFYNYDNEPYYYNDFDLSVFNNILNEKELQIASEMMNCNTKENWKRREN